MTLRQAAVQTIRVAHYAILAWGVTGWAIPSNAWLIAYLFAMPLIAVQWVLNRNTCLLNNLESWIVTGRWRDRADPEQGGFIAGFVEKVSGWRPSGRAANLISYGLLGVLWCVAATHLARR